MSFLRTVVDRSLRVSGLQYWPVRVRSGIARGARWTLYPWTSYWRGTQEPVMHRALAGLGDLTGWSCWDLGAHFGIYSIGLARRVGPTGQVAAFEPNVHSFRRLERHRDLNGLAWLKLYHAAISATAGEVDLYNHDDPESTTTHLLYGDEPADYAGRSVRVPMIALDDLVRRGEIRPPNLMKIDVEGHGHQALAGAIESIRATRPIIFIGLHSAMEVNGTRALLDPLGYTWAPLEPNPPADCIGADFVLRAP